MFFLVLEVVSSHIDELILEKFTICQSAKFLAQLKVLRIAVILAFTLKWMIFCL